MTARQPFTSLCQQLARPCLADRVDLHLHTNHSDGFYTPAQVVDLARRSGLPAVAITDHDTIDGVEPARAAAQNQLEVISGVELTTHFQGREQHLLGYFFRLDDLALNTALAQLRRKRAERFLEMVDRLRGCGVVLEPADLPGADQQAALGRRHLAELLVRQRRAGTVQQAFRRYLGDHGRVHVPNPGLPMAEAIWLVRNAGGVAAWAHPAYDGAREILIELRCLGLQAVEVEYPSCQRRRGQELRHWARELDLAITGGSDCHGPAPANRTIGAFGITWQELERLQEALQIADCRNPNDGG